MSRRPALPRRWFDRWLAAGLLIGALAALFPAAAVAQTQFDSPGAPEYEMLNEKGEVVNLAPPLVKPVIVTPDEQYVVAINEADGRLAVHDALTGAVVGEPFVGQGAVSLAARTSTEIWVSCQMDVKVVDLSTMRVTAVLRPPIDPAGNGAPDAAWPAGIAFSADGSRAWVVGSFSGVINAYDTVTKAHIAPTVPLSVPHNGSNPRVKEPRAIVAKDGKLYVVVHKSGNQTTTSGQGRFALFVQNRSLEPDPNKRFPDADVLILSDVTGALLGSRDRIGTLGFGITFLPDGTAVVANLHSRNGELVGEASFDEGRVTRNRLTFFDPANPAAPPTYVETENLAANIAGALPTDVVSSPSASGSLYVACQGSSSILVFANSGSHVLQGKIVTENGPRGLALAPGLQRLYCYNDGPRSLTCYSVASGIPTAALFTVPVGKFDPTYTRVREGRALFHRARNSAVGTTGCFSCHPDGRDDGLAWDIGKYNDPPGPFTDANQPQWWRDNKAPMITQSLRGIEDTAPYHWRGEQKDLEDFNGAFVDLLHGTKLTDSQFAKMKAFLFSLPLPPNPNERLNRTLSALAGGTPGGGLDVFRTPVVIEGQTCAGCHQLPTGTDNSITDHLGQENNSGVSTRGTETALLEGIVFKESDQITLNDSPTPISAPVTGAGFNHTGGSNTLRGFINLFPLTPQQKDAVTQFVRELDTSLAPVTAWCEQLKQSTVATHRIGSYAIPQADAGHCDLGARGTVRLVPGGPLVDIGLLYVPGTGGQPGSFGSNITGVGPFSLTQLESMALAGDADLLFCGAPIWSGQRLFRDRDRDIKMDGDEQGLDPSNPDFDGDGFWDGEDPSPTTFDTVVSAPAPQVIARHTEFVSTNIVRLTYETDRLSPTEVLYGDSTAYGQSVGDDLTAIGNHWKRHHTAVLRVLLDNHVVHFKIKTRGQNGATAETVDLTVSAKTDPFRPTMRVDKLTVTLDSPTNPTQVTATLRIVDNDGVGVSGAQIHGVWTVFDAAGNVVTQVGGNSQTTATGDAALVRGLSLPAGGYVQFCVPTSRIDSTATVAGVEPPIGQPALQFAWPESKIIRADTR